MDIDVATSLTEFTGIAFFAVAAWACWRASRTAGPAWRRLAALQALLLVELVFRGRYHLHDAVDDVARADGWYLQRASLQLWLIGIVVGIALVSWFIALRDPRPMGAAATALVATIAAMLLFAVEAVSLHDLDALLYAWIGPLRAVAIGWIATATVVTLSALHAARA